MELFVGQKVRVKLDDESAPLGTVTGFGEFPCDCGRDHPRAVEVVFDEPIPVPGTSMRVFGVTATENRLEPVEWGRPSLSEQLFAVKIALYDVRRAAVASTPRPLRWLTRAWLGISESEVP